MKKIGSSKSKIVANKQKELSALLVEDVWPNERDFIERPERLKYVRKLARPKGCVFCKAERSQIEFDSLKVYESKWSMVILNKYPYNTGHLLVLPRRHCGDLLELDRSEYEDLSRLLRASLKILKQSYTCSGFNLGMNHGSVAGAGIPQHLHWHIIPRWLGDTNFFPLIAETKVLPESVEQAYARLLPLFQTLRRKSL